MSAEDHFEHFADSIRSILKVIKRDNETRANELARLEIEWRDAVVAHKWGKKAYNDFIVYFRDDLHNIRACRPYFRERNETFSERVSKPMANGDWKTLQDAHPNWNFVKHLTEHGKWFPNSPVRLLAEQIRLVRDELIKTNLPIVVSRSKLFYNKQTNPRLQFMDFCQIGVEGLMSGIDKYGGDWASQWGSTIIGRITGNHISNNSEVQMHLYPREKNALYRIRRAVAKMTDEIDLPQIVKEVNEGNPDPLSESEVAELMASQSWHSTDGHAKVDDEDGIATVESQYCENGPTPEQVVADVEALDVVRAAANTLPLWCRKILTIKGMGGIQA